MSIFNQPIKTDNIVKACDYSKVIKTLSISTPWKATQDCWIYGQVYIPNKDVTIYLSVDGVSIVRWRGDNYTTGTTVAVSGIFVKKGSTVNFTSNGDEKIAVASSIKAYGCLK